MGVEPGSEPSGNSEQLLRARAVVGQRLALRTVGTWWTHFFLTEAYDCEIPNVS